MSLFQTSPERVKPMLEIRREYINAIYNEIIEKYGTIESYLYQVCNIEQSSLQNLKNLLRNKTILSVLKYKKTSYNT
ncbi:tyrosine-protein phosphatase [Bacillus rhizoplanae]|uniref:tyrosine-protein phosphatase n=1 Tax=Bacillus rhizoplanae TaxID=2880966 RepID=UPI003D193033